MTSLKYLHNSFALGYSKFLLQNKEPSHLGRQTEIGPEVQLIKSKW